MRRERVQEQTLVEIESVARPLACRRVHTHTMGGDLATKALFNPPDRVVTGAGKSNWLDP